MKERGGLHHLEKDTAGKGRKCTEPAPSTTRLGGGNAGGQEVGRETTIIALKRGAKLKESKPFL